MNWYLLVIFLHVAGAFVFALSHGVSMAMAFRLRREREPARIAALLDMSGASIMGVYVGLLVVLATGVILGFMGGFWGRLWIWLAMALLIGLVVAMYYLATTYYSKVRNAIGVKGLTEKADAPMPAAASPETLAALLESPTPFVLAAVGGGGLVVLLWLMYYQPF